MTASPRVRRISRRLRLLRRRVTFANVTAVLALFLSLGGSSYAALRVGSAQIANNSVGSKDLRDNGVRGRDIRNGTVRGTDVRNGGLRGRDLRKNTITGAAIQEPTLATVPRARDAQSLAGKPAAAYLGGDADTLGGKPASAFLDSDKQVRTGLVELAHGETETIAVHGPFTWRAACTDDGGGDTGLTVTVETTEADSLAGDFGGGGQAVSPGAPVPVFNASDSVSAYTIGFPLTAVAPSGAAPVGLAFVGLNVLNADCVVNGVLWP